MSEASSHHYQGRQSALQVFKEFGGGVGDPSLHDEDDDEDDDQDQDDQQLPETEKEKVLPFYQSDPDTQNVPDIDIEKISGLDKNNAFGEFKMLDNFYKRYNKVHLDKLAIEKQKATLEKEN